MVRIPNLKRCIGYEYMEYSYKNDYPNIGFRVIFTRIIQLKGVLGFAAQPYEMMLHPQLNSDPKYFLIRGRIEIGERIMIGFTDFSFEMTNELHERLGELYEILKTEYRITIIKKT